MSESGSQARDHNEYDIGDQNVERLLGHAYRPEEVDRAFEDRVAAMMQAVARESATARAGQPSLVLVARGRRPSWMFFAGSTIAAAVLIAFGFILGRQIARPVDTVVATRPTYDTPLLNYAIRSGDRAKPQSDVTVDGRFVQGTVSTAASPRGMTPRARETVPMQPVKLSASLRTGAAERRRDLLPDGSVLYMDQATEVTVDADREITLHAGNVYVEVAPSETAHVPGARTFMVRTKDREITAFGTKFAVRSDADRATVAVTQGKVQLSDYDQTITAGQQFARVRHAPSQDTSAVSPLPRASYVLDWTRGLVSAAETPLVPNSAHAGGSIVARDPNGQDTRLTLRKYHIDVHIEDGFARTTIDQTYFNHTSWRLEGTFHFPLPTDASLSRLAMYVEGKLMEGGMAERNYAREVFEKIVRTQKDPALLEWVDGSTFKMRVFPLEARQEKRIILSYTQRLDSLYGQWKYRFPAGHSLETVRDWSFHARIKDRDGLTWQCDSHDLKQAAEGRDLLLTAEANEVKLDRDVVLRGQESFSRLTGQSGQAIAERTTPDVVAAKWSAYDHEGQRYLMIRYRPELPTKAQRQRRDWVFLFESSGDRDPVLARVQVDVIKTLLQNTEHDDTFAILTAGTQVRTFSKEALPATPGNVRKAVEFLESVHLVGALDLAQALSAMEPFVRAGRNPYIVHLGSGVPVLGERADDKLLAQLPSGARYVGVGVGKRWSRQFMKAAASRTGGYFTQINPDEPVTWRAFDLYSTLNTPRLLNVSAVDHAERASFQLFSDSIAHGEELCAITRVAASDSLPEKVVISGTLDGEPFRRVLTVDNISHNASYLPRTWAKLRIDQLLVDDAARHRDEIIALSKSMYVMSPFTSLLVLETEQMYVQFNVDRGRKDHWALYACPDRIPVVYEPLAVAPAIDKNLPAQSSGTPTMVSVPELIESVQLSTIDDQYFFVVEPKARGSEDTANRNSGIVHRYPIVSDRFKLGSIHAPATSGVYGRGLSLFINESLPLNYWYEVSGSRQDFTAHSFGLMNELQNEHQVMAKLRQPVSANFKDTSLGDTVDWLRDSMGLNIVIDQPALASAGVSTEEAKVNLRLEAVPARNLLKHLLSQQHLTYQVQGDVLKITTPLEAAKDVIQRQENLSHTWLSTRLNRVRHSDQLGLQTAFVDDHARRIPLGVDYTGIAREYRERVEQEVRLLRQKTERFRDGALPMLTAPDATDWDHLIKARLESGFGAKLEGANQRLGRYEGWGYSGSIFQSAFQNVAKGLELNPPLGGEYDAIPSSGEWSTTILWPLLQPDTLTYRRSNLTENTSIFSNLVAFAPGMSTTWADVLGLIDADSTTRISSGTVDPRARDLIEKARSSDWRSAVFPAHAHYRSHRAAWNGLGQFSIERTVVDGLREQVICDGTTLWHLYPELGIGAKRQVSPIHRAAFTDMLPWLIPPIEDLARKHDLQAIDDHTVALVSRGVHEAKGEGDNPIASVRIHLIFGEDGRLAERRRVEMPSGKTLVREILGTDGVVKLNDENENTLAAWHLIFEPAAAPNLTPDSKNLVVVSAPIRTREYVHRHARPQDGRFANWTEDNAIALIASDIRENPDEAMQVVGQRFFARGDRRIGFYTLLLASGRAWDPTSDIVMTDNTSVRFDPMADHPQSTLAKYFFLHLQQIASSGQIGEIDLAVNGAGGFVHRLAAFRDLFVRWKPDAASKAAALRRNRDQAIEFIRQSDGSVFGWTVLSMLQDHATDAESYRRLTELYPQFQNQPGLSYAARYEEAYCLYQSGEGGRAKQLLRELFMDVLRRGEVPPLDERFRLAFEGKLAGPAESAAWLSLWRDAAEVVLARNDRVAALALAWQCHKLGDTPMADELLAAAMRGIAEDARGPMSLAAIEYLCGIEQYHRAYAFLEPLLQDERFAQDSWLWRLGALLAGRIHMTARSVECLDRAMDIEFANLPLEVDLESARAAFSALLLSYHELAQSITSLPLDSPAEMVGRVVRAADRWRLLDPDDTQPCQSAARVLLQLGAHDRAWEYLTTPFSDKPGEPPDWLSLGKLLRDQGNIELAERAYAMAFAADPTNAAILWEHAQALEQRGKPDAAQKLYERLADGSWADSYEAIKQRSRKIVESLKKPEALAAP